MGNQVLRSQQPFSVQQQQQWYEAQQKAVEEQKKQFMKQRQFDQQKQKLKAFSTSKAKVNILFYFVIFRKCKVF